MGGGLHFSFLGGNGLSNLCQKTKPEKSSAKDPDLLDPKHFGFLDPDPQKYADPRGKILI